MNNEKLAVEKLLPEKFIYQIGVYLQTCAHIEVASSALIATLEGKTPKDEEWLKQYYSIRKLPTAKLIKRLTEAHSRAEDYGFSSEIKQLAEWIKEFVGNRHMAAHGAFFGSPNEFLRVDFVEKTGGQKLPVFEPNRTAITASLVDDAIKDANGIYLILLGMLEKIKPGLTIEVHSRIIPIVEHPED